MFERQCWWVTGASSGIGEGLSRALAARGGRPVAMQRRRGLVNGEENRFRETSGDG